MAGGTREAMLHISLPYHHHHAHTEYVTAENYHHTASTEAHHAHHHQHHILGTGVGPGEGYRHPSSAPLRKLTVDLIKTYRKINDVSMCGCECVCMYTRMPL